MIEANIKNLSRTELLYSCIAKLARRLHKLDRDDVLESLEHYYDKNDFNRTFYYSNSTSTEDITQMLLRDADTITGRCRDGWKLWMNTVC